MIVAETGSIIVGLFAGIVLDKRMAVARGGNDI
jgi:hypothetical protein